MHRRQFLTTALMAGTTLAAPAILGSRSAFAAGGKSFRLAISIYAGWMPWYFAHQKGLVDKWAKKYGINIAVDYYGYGPSMDAYNAGKADALVIASMDAMDMPVAAGIDTSVVIMGDYSNGNDAVLTRFGLGLKDLKGKEVRLMQGSVSSYVLARALQTVGLKDTDCTIVNVSDEDISAQFIGGKNMPAAVTWNPMVLEIMQEPGVKKIFDSSQIPGEVQDLCVVNSKVLNASPDFARALTGVWYEVLALMSQRGPQAESAIADMGAIAKNQPTADAAATAEMKAQLRTTAMFYTPQAALDFTRSAELKTKNALVHAFCLDHALLANPVGLVYPDGSTYGSTSGAKLRYDDRFMAEAAAGTLK